MSLILRKTVRRPDNSEVSSEHQPTM
jgi:hypothetical protein